MLTFADLRLTFVSSSNREAFGEMMATCFPAAVADRDNIEEHIFRMYDDNKVGFETSEDYY